MDVGEKGVANFDVHLDGTFGFCIFQFESWWTLA